MTAKKSNVKKFPATLTAEDFTAMSEALELAEIVTANGVTIGRIHLREISVDTMIEVQAGEEEGNKAGAVRQGVGLLAASVVTPEGDPMFTREQAGKLPLSVFMAIMTKVNAKFGIKGEDEGKGNPAPAVN